MTKFFDPAIPRKSSIVDDALATDGNAIPIPSVVEVSESGTCNRKCVFCPRSAPDYPDVKEFIDPNLIDKLSSQLSEVGFRGIFLFSGFVEPTLDKNIFDLVALVHGNLPKAKVEMVTNGDVLDDDKLNRLFESGLSTILISVYDGKEDADRFEDMCKKAGLQDDQYVIRHRYLPEEESFGITLGNRAGMMDDAEFPVPSLKEPMDHPCHYPHYTFFMDYLGDVMLCPHDWGKKYILGNMNSQDFLDIWTGAAMSSVRDRLAKGDRLFSPCDVCDVEGTLMGGEHVKVWAALKQKP